MSENAADSPAIESACRDIDRYISETSKASSNDAQVLSPSERLRVLGRQQSGSSGIQPATPDTATPLLA